MVGALAAGAAIVLYDGSPFSPTATVLWDVIDEAGWAWGVFWSALVLLFTVDVLHGWITATTQAKLVVDRPVFLNLFSATTPLSNCPFKLYKQMYLLVNVFIKLYMLQSA